MVNFKLDLGAQANVISLAALTTAKPEQGITPTVIILTEFGEGRTQPLGDNSGSVANIKGKNGELNLT